LPWFPRDASGDDDHIRAGHILPVGRADARRILPNQRAILHDVEGFAFRYPLFFGDIDEHDVTELLFDDLVREFTTDISCADETDLLACHVLALLPHCQGLRYLRHRCMEQRATSPIAQASSDQRSRQACWPFALTHGVSYSTRSREASVVTKSKS